MPVTKLLRGYFFLFPTTATLSVVFFPPHATFPQFSTRHTCFLPFLPVFHSGVKTAGDRGGGGGGTGKLYTHTHTHGYALRTQRRLLIIVTVESSPRAFNERARVALCPHGCKSGRRVPPSCPLAWAAHAPRMRRLSNFPEKTNAHARNVRASTRRGGKAACLQTASVTLTHRRGTGDSFLTLTRTETTTFFFLYSPQPL